LWNIPFSRPKERTPSDEEADRAFAAHGRYDLEYFEYNENRSLEEMWQCSQPFHFGQSFEEIEEKLAIALHNDQREQCAPESLFFGAPNRQDWEPIDLIGPHPSHLLDLIPVSFHHAEFNLLLDLQNMEIRSNGFTTQQFVTDTLGRDWAIHFRYVLDVEEGGAERFMVALQALIPDVPESVEHQVAMHPPKKRKTRKSYSYFYDLAEEEAEEAELETEDSRFLLPLNGLIVCSRWTKGKSDSLKFMANGIEALTELQGETVGLEEEDVKESGLIIKTLDFTHCFTEDHPVTPEIDVWMTHFDSKALRRAEDRGLHEDYFKGLVVHDFDAVRLTFVLQTISFS